METFDKSETIKSIERFLVYGEKTYEPKGPNGHAGYFSGDAWAAKVLRSHLEDLKRGKNE